MSCLFKLNKHDTVICGSVQTSSLIAHMFVEPQKETYLYFFFAISTSLRSNENIYECLVEKYLNIKRIITFCSHPLKFLLPSRFFVFSISFLFITKECLKEFRYCASGPGCSKIVNFCRTEAGLTSKWGRISPAVY